jgi:pimeloyl-ACP methyl ester carboxylesterase
MAPIPDLAVVVCHGSYHTPAPYGPLLEALQTRGIAAYCPQLPTADLAKLNVGDVNNPDFDQEPPPGGYPQGEEDSEAVLEVLRPLVEAGKEVLLVGHSSGGWTATQVAQPELQAKVRKAKGLAGGVIGVFYAGAFVIPVGESISSFFQPKDGSFVTPPFMTFHVSTYLIHLSQTSRSTAYRPLTSMPETRPRRTWYNRQCREIPLQRPRRSLGEEVGSYVDCFSYFDHQTHQRRLLGAPLRLLGPGRRFDTAP